MCILLYGSIRMQESVKVGQSSLTRKIMTIALLPIIIVVWMTGWILTQIALQGELIEIKQKTVPTHLGNKEHAKETKAPNEDSTIINEPQIVA